jgi:hypothetical protein
MLKSVPMLAGVPVDTELVRELIDRVDEPTAGQLEGALDAGRAVVALTIADRERILRALEDCPDEPAELRGVLLREHEWRRREGLVELADD